MVQKLFSLDNSLPIKDLSTRDQILLLEEIFFRQKDLKDAKSMPRLDTRKPVPHYFVITLKNFEKVFPGSTVGDFKKFYAVNDYGLRSDEFTNQHEGKHILFAGCSNTFGMGMPEHAIWPRLVYNKIAENEKLSGFFNIGISGGSMTEIYNQIIAYTKKFGVPDVLFINFPDHGREIGRMAREKRPQDVAITALDSNFLYEINVGFFQTIMTMFSKLNTEVYIMTWDYSMLDPGINLWISEDPRMLMDSLTIADNEEASRHILEYHSLGINKEYKKFFTTALDNDHPGFGMHSYWAKVMYEKYCLKDTVPPVF